MNKLNLNESLRIYIPGLYLSLVSFYIYFQTIEGTNNILLPAIFIGLIFNSIFGGIHEKYFLHLESKKLFKDKNFIENWIEIVMTKMKQFNIEPVNSLNKKEVNLETKYEVELFVNKTFFSKRYNSPELTYFRFPKSFGVMFFNLSIASLIGIIASVIKIAFYSHDLGIVKFQVILICVLIPISIIFFRTSKKYFSDSLKREISYWKTLSKSEMEEVSELMYLWEKTS
jgi:hypothetical protein